MISLKIEQTPEAFVPFQVQGPDGTPVVEINDFFAVLGNLWAFRLHPALLRQGTRPLFWLVANLGQAS
jgi:hypothetical protein